MDLTQQIVQKSQRHVISMNRQLKTNAKEECPTHSDRLSKPQRSADLNARGIAAPSGGQWFPMQVRRVRDRLGL